MSSDAIRSDALADAHLILNVRREGRARGCLEVEGAHLWGRGAGAVVSTTPRTIKLVNVRLNAILATLDENKLKVLVTGCLVKELIRQKSTAVLGADV